MKHRFWLFRRGSMFYLQNVETGQRESLQTRDRKEAERLRQAREDTYQRPSLGLTVGRAYLAAYDPKLPERRWEEVMKEFLSKGQAVTQERYRRALENPPFSGLSRRKIIETTADDLRLILSDGKSSTNHFLRRLHNLAVGLGWLPWPLIPAKLWPQVRTKRRRSVTLEQHRRILAAETNVERRQFYELLWEVGAAQSDAANLQAENIDWGNRILTYQRRKTGEWARLMIGSSLEALLRKLPNRGPLFPTISKTPASARSAEFCRRCRLLGFSGVSLHSYRYAWAERALSSGYPERWAQHALGHSSKAIHRAYAKAAHVICPPLEQFEQRALPNLVVLPPSQEVMKPNAAAGIPVQANKVWETRSEPGAVRASA